METNSIADYDYLKAKFVELMAWEEHEKHGGGHAQPGCPYCVERPGWDE